MLDVRAISFQWPVLLWLLLLIPILVALYWRLTRSKHRLVNQFPGLLPRGDQATTAKKLPALMLSRMRSLILPLMFALGLSALLAAVARPQALLAMPQRQLDIMLAIDTSSSMRATDLTPNRLAAAQSIAQHFIEGLPPYVRMGLISVAATASLAQSPTKDREALRQAVDRLDAQRGTALGSGIIIALATLRPDADLDVEKLTTGRSSRQWQKDTAKSDGKKREPVEAGSNQNMAIVLLSDGKSTLGPDPKEASKLAADLGIRVYSIGVGTSQGATLKVDGINMRVRLEEEALQEVAKTTSAEYFEASRPDDLKKIFQTLNARLVLEKPKQTEITSLFIALGTLLIVLSALMSLFIKQRVI
jgi:Ca-activated chloride channel homolog